MKIKRAHIIGGRRAGKTDATKELQKLFDRYSTMPVDWNLVASRLGSAVGDLGRAHRA